MTIAGSQPVDRRPPGARARRPALGAAAVLALALVPAVAAASVLTRQDLDAVSGLKTQFERLLTDLTLTAQQPDLGTGDSACIGATRNALLQIAGELKSYESLITIEDRLNEDGDDAVLRSSVRFAVENALKLLDAERGRMSEIAGSCAAFPVSLGKTRDAIQFVEGTVAVLKLVRARL